MQKTLLSTKLNVPTPRQALVLRPELVTFLSRASTKALTLVSAPPGYGKTTLVSSWLSSAAVVHTWLSLDEGDNDPIRFLEYFLAAIHKVVSNIRPDMLDLLHDRQAPSFEALVTLLINETAGSDDFTLVLDDFHAISSPPVLDIVAYLLEHLPPVMHIVLLSRTDPPLPLSRLRARGQLLEIRAEQLRFTQEEIALFFRDVMGLKLSDLEVSAIDTRTEGWIAGLQLAGLALQGVLGPRLRSTESVDPHSFLVSFTGSHAYIMDYLTEETLRYQPEATRSFLLQTSILERMCGPLCEAVVGADPTEPNDGQAMLETIEQNHLFVIPLDGERRWYRYHHLFKEVLSRRLEVLVPGQIPTLHRRASEWYEQHGLIHEAIHHAIKSHDLDCAARLVEQHGCDFLMGGELMTLADWLASIDPYTRTRPWLAMQKAWVLSLSGQSDRAEMAIDTGEQLLSTRELTDEVRTLRGSFAAARAHWANTQGMPGLAAQAARHAVDLLSVGGDFSCALRSVATSLLGDASWVQGKMEEARRAYAEAVKIGQIAGNPHMTMMSNTRLADVYFEQGQLHQAARLYAETLQMAERVDGPNSSYAQDTYFGLSRVYYAWNRLDEAAVSSEQCLRLCRHWGNGNLQAACFALIARIHRALGSIGRAQESAAAAEGWIGDHMHHPYWSMWVKTTLARFWLDEGKTEKAVLSIHDTGIFPHVFSANAVPLTGIPLDDPIPYRLEPACLILARLFLAVGNPDAVLSISERLLPDANTGGRGKVALELLILKALAYQAKREPSFGLAALEEAISLAWPEQARRVFLDEGERMAKLLYQANAHHIGGAFAEDILAAMDDMAGTEHPLAHPSRRLPVEMMVQGGQRLLVEPLSARELEVLRAIAEGCSNQEIADRFVLSPKTVKRHLSNIYAKLEAKNRTQAVALARVLKLID
jgi:LuxR family maltose regulon positive regulatory protein